MGRRELRERLSEMCFGGSGDKCSLIKVIISQNP